MTTELPSYLTTGPAQHCPACGGSFPYAGPLNTSLRFPCPLCQVPLVFQRTGVSTEKEIEADPVCQLCGAGMVKRRGKYGEFWGCSSYKKTKCRGKPRYSKTVVVEWEVALVEWKEYTGEWTWADPVKIARRDKAKEKEERWRR